ncbi:AMP-binding protein [Actinocorallia sp. API 0066]|uniref:class I adenylate-forming enzyme family protein n=1 Tax=Actinocorallia sp. API 0066 TaxID=2896846 RepID=UPI001E314746|nr:AMP-binding protein [Actinocorallia sp. API 0066]MCD0453048.1 AMP-binding protein [Actinocorallia sp. API 0066]
MKEPEHGTPEHWARLRPDAPAVVHGAEVMTYGQWNDRADAVAEGLAALGLGPGDRLGMRFHLGLEWFVVQRALQKLRVAQVAVNWKLTPDEAAYIITDSDAKGLACNDADASGWAAHDVGILLTVGQPPGSPGVRYEDLVTTPVVTPRFGPLRPALVMYTSGTTGAPRGVPPTDPRTVSDPDRLMRYAMSTAKVPPYPERSATLLTLPVHHGAGPASAVRTCAGGGTVVVLSRFDPEEALRLIERHRIRTWTAVPTMLLRIQNLPEQTFARYDVSSLTALTTGAAPVPQSLKEWVIDRFGDGVLWEAYGASEAGMISYTPPEYQLTKPGTSGIPYDGVEIAIVDDDWNRLPPGLTGEIAVNTPIVLTRYLGRDELGADTVKDGFYRTGDVGHLDEDGFLFITDRIKDMIVAGGVNIYPAEIEKVLIRHPAVADVAVVGIPHDDFGEQPLAFVVTAPGATVTEDELVRFLDGRLASYKRPRVFTFVDELPVNPMGKVLKNVLRAPYWKGRRRHV